MMRLLMLLLASVMLWLMSSCQGPSFALRATEGALRAEGGAAELMQEQRERNALGVLVMMGIGAVLAVALAVALAVGKQRRNEEEEMDNFGERSPQGPDFGTAKGFDQLRGKAARDPEPAEAGTTIHGEDPLGMSLEVLDWQRMKRITDALFENTMEAAMWVENARQTLCRHEQEDMLRMAGRALKPVNRCLPDLKEALVLKVAEVERLSEAVRSFTGNHGEVKL